MDDMQKSELVIAKILQLLMDWGVQSCQMKFQELELDKEYLNFYTPCVNWLIDEGVIRVSDVSTVMSGDSRVLNPVLTSYGMRVLGTKLQLDGRI